MGVRMLLSLIKFKKKQLVVKVEEENPLSELWISIRSENLKRYIIKKYKLRITTRTFEQYIYGDSFPLYFLKCLIKEYIKKFPNKDFKRIVIDIEKNIKWIQFRSTRGGKSKWVRIPNICSELFYLGGVMRDGSINFKLNRITVTQESCQEWLENIVAPKFKKVFGVLPTVKNGRLILYSGAVTYMLAILFNFPLTSNQLEWGRVKIVDQYFWDLELQKNYVCGYYDAEGSTDLKRKIITISQASIYNNKEKSLLQIKRILKKIGINSEVVGPYKNKNSYISTLVIYTKRKRINYDLFMKEINPLHPIKSKRLNMLYDK